MKFSMPIAAIATSIFSFSVHAEDKVMHPVVFELFTSQGCSSCPPADAIASGYADQEGVLLLSYHVNYWDNLGWKDPYGSAANTDRQREYARYFSARNVYTPQAVIQGGFNVVGSNRTAVQNALRNGAKTEQWIPVKLSLSGRKISISLPASNALDANVILVGYQKFSENDVTRGENAGSRLSHRNSVKNVTLLGSWHGNEIALKQDKPEGDGVAVLIQSTSNGKIIGAAWM